MKIIALLPVKNEAWILPTYLSGMLAVADEIIALDDSSIDTTAHVLGVSEKVTVIRNKPGDEPFVNMGQRRRTLLAAGRAAGGTHFICLDADEVFSYNFIQTARDHIMRLAPGQKMTLRWAHPWKNTSQFLDDPCSAHGYIWKDFIFCDDGVSDFDEKFLSEGRTPGGWGTPLQLPESDGVVLHFQFLNGDAMHYKHIWYRCQELIEGSRNARRINATYVVDYDEHNTLHTTPIPDSWVENLTLPTSGNTIIWHRDQIMSDFKKYGIEFFEPLDIWYLPELRTLFIQQTGRQPVAKKFPQWLLFLNKYKNKVINFWRERHT